MWMIVLIHKDIYFPIVNRFVLTEIPLMHTQYPNTLLYIHQESNEKDWFLNQLWSSIPH